jgi:cytochrome c oxidase subunit III
VGVIILLIAALAAIVVWWLSKQRLMAKPWLEEGALGEFPGTGASSVPAAKIGLGVFVAVVAALFALFLSAYVMRMQLTDWRPVPKPTLLWINTGVLILSSAGLQWAQDAADRRDVRGIRAGLYAGGAAALAFLLGQLLAWQQLRSMGYFLATNPAASFYYLITAVHGLHLIGGLAALGRTILKGRRGVEIRDLRASIELCTIYWHFLLVVWLVLFGFLLLS